MAVKFKLKRVGTKKKPSFRVVLLDESRAPGSCEIENIGNYDARQTPTLFNVKKDRVEYWLSKGAQPTDKLRILFGKAGLMPAVDLAGMKKRKPKSEEKADKAAAVEAAAATAAAAKAAATAEVKKEA